METGGERKVSLLEPRPLGGKGKKKRAPCLLLTIFLFYQATVGSDSYARKTWFHNMLSIPPRQTLTSLNLFTAWSAFMAYVVGGILGVAYPPLSALLNMKLSGREQEYWRLSCGALAGIGFFYIVTARSRPMVAGNGAILGTVPERVFFVTAVLMWLFRQSLVPLRVVVTFTLLDTTLATITYIIWSRNTPGASPKKCLVEIAKLMLPILGPAKKCTSNCVQMIGYIQMAISLTFMAKPEIARDAMGLDAFEGYSKGLIALFFMQMAIIGWFHVLGGGDGNESCPIAAVFYRLAWSTPLISLMYYFDCIERGFAVSMGIADLIGAIVILIPLCIEALSSK